MQPWSACSTWKWRYLADGDMVVVKQQGAAFFSFFSCKNPQGCGNGNGFPVSCSLEKHTEPAAPWRS